MKKIIIYLILCFMAVVVFGQTNVPAIVVSTFSARGQAVSADDAESITELFIAELANQSGVRVVDRTSIERVVSEMRFQTSDWSNPQKTTQLGAALNAEYLVRGQINQLGQQVTVSITALDINTLEIVSSSTKTFEVNRIFGNDKYNSGRYMETNIFGAMPDIASGIASPIKTKMVELAKKRLEQEQLQGIVGTWIAKGSDSSFSKLNIINAENSMVITFSNNGTVYATIKHCFQTGSGSRYSNSPDPVRVTKLTTNASGYYTLSGNKLTINWAEDRSGVIYTFNYEQTRAEQSNINVRGEQTSYTNTIEISPNGKNMTFDFNRWNIPTIFVKQ